MKAGDKIQVEVDKDAQPVFIVNGERAENPEAKKAEAPAEEKKAAKKK